MAKTSKKHAARTQKIASANFLSLVNEFEVYSSGLQERFRKQFGFYKMKMGKACTRITLFAVYIKLNTKQLNGPFGCIYHWCVGNQGSFPRGCVRKDIQRNKLCHNQVCRSVKADSL